MTNVMLWKDKKTISTLELGPLNPNPVFETYESYRPYPYPYAFQMGDKIKEDIEYITLNIENEYLRVIILPELGSRVYSIYDKINKKELIHKPDFINMTYLPGTAGGTYVGVGMELSIPDHHSLTNSRKREFSTYENADGSKTICVGELDLRYMMRWSMQFTLKPGVAALFHEVTIHNQSDTNGRFRYWANAGVSLEDKNIEFIFREKDAWEHGGEFQVMSWPIYDGIDMRFPAKIPNTAGFEPKDVKDGFFAYYDHKDNYGLVHWADPGTAKGKKYWAWGQSANATHRARLFSDGKKFMEFQSGRDEDQEIFEILEPAATVQWEEIWYPVGNLGTISYATDFLAIALPSSDNNIIKDGKLNFRLQAIVNLREIKVCVIGDTKCLAEKQFSIHPGEVKELKLKMMGKCKSPEGIKLIFKSSDNKVLLEYEITKQKNVDKYIDIISDTSEEHIDRSTDYLMSELHLRMRRFPQPKYVTCDDLLEEILRKDPKHAEALKIKGIFLHEKGLFDDSYLCLQQSRKRNFCDGESCYYLGLNAYQKGDFSTAWLEFSEAVKFNWRSSSFFYMGIIAFMRMEFTKAEKMFNNALDYNANYTRARVYLAFVKSRQGDLNSALNLLKEAKRRFPGDPLIIVAKSIIKEGSLNKFRDSKSGKKIVSQLHGDIQTYYEIVLNLFEIGLYSEAIEFIDEINIICANSNGIGMLPFYRYFACCKSGKQSKLKTDFKNDSILYTFPFRQRELKMLSFVLDADPKNKFANYYSGLIMGSVARYKEAENYISKALDNGLEHPVVVNILGRIFEKSFANDKRALEFYNQSLNLNPDNIFTRLYLVDLLIREKDFEQLDKLFDHPSTFNNLQLLCKFIDHNIAKGDFDKAIDTLENKVSFHNMAQELYGRYSSVLIKQAVIHMNKNNFNKAINNLNKCFTLPPQFGGNEWKENYNLKAEYFLGKTYKLKGNLKKSEEIWTAGIKKLEQSRDWTMSGAWSYGLWINRFYQGWMLKELGQTAEAVTYFDAIRTFAAHKFNSLLSTTQRKDLLRMAYNGLNDKEIANDETDETYLSLE
jgi:tetratricopeptide (TPR) repeat protein